MSSKCDCDYFFTMSNVEHALHKRIKINIFHKNWFEQEITVLGDWVPSKCFWVYASFSINGMFTFEWKEVMVEIATVVMITVCSDCQHMIAYVCVIWIRNYCPSQDWSSVYTYVCMWGRIQGFWTGTVPIISIFVRTCKMWTYVQNSTLFSTKLISWPSTLKWWSCSVMRVKLQSQCYKPLWLRFCLTLATKVCT
jgi:hypothetical protein